MRAFPIVNTIRLFPKNSSRAFPITDDSGVSLPDGAILLSGDMQAGTDRELLSGDMQAGTDVLQTSAG